MDEFLYLGNDDVQFPHFLARDYLRDVGGVKLSRRSAGTSGQTRRLRRGELAVMTYLDLETDAASRRKDPGKVTVNVNASVTGVLLGHKMVAGKGPLVNVEGVPATETLLNGDSNGSAVPFSEWFPFLIHHITRSYEECKWKDGWGGDRQGTWRHKMPISICEKQNATTAYYVKGDHMERPNSVETHILSMKPRLCEKMRQLNPDYCNKVNCCSQNL